MSEYYTTTRLLYEKKDVETLSDKAKNSKHVAEIEPVPQVAQANKHADEKHIRMNETERPINQVNVTEASHQADNETTSERSEKDYRIL